METKLREVKLLARSYKAQHSNPVLQGSGACFLQRQGCVREPEERAVGGSLQVVLRLAGGAKTGPGGASAVARALRAQKPVRCGPHLSPSSYLLFKPNRRSLTPPAFGNDSKWGFHFFDR